MLCSGRRHVARPWCETSLPRSALEQGECPVVLAAPPARLRCSENNSGTFPRGLNHFLRVLRGWLYGRDPFEQLQWAAPLEGLKAELATADNFFGGWEAQGPAY